MTEAIGRSETETAGRLEYTLDAAPPAVFALASRPDLLSRVEPALASLEVPDVS